MAARRERGLLDPNAAPGESAFDHHIYALVQRRRHRGGRQRRGVVHRRHPAARQPDRSSTTPTGSRSRTTPTSRCPRTSATRYEAYGWHVQTVDWTNDGHDVRRGRARPLRAPSRRPSAVTDQPSFIVLRTIIAWPAPNAAEHRQGPRLARSATTRSPPPRRCSASTPTRPSRSPPGVLEHTRAGRRARQGGPGRVGGARSTHWATKPSADVGALRADADPHAPRRLGRRRCPTFGRRARRASRPGWRRARSSTRSPARCPSCGAARPTSPESNNTTIEGVPSFAAQGPLDQDVRRRPVRRPGAALRHPRARAWARS